MKNFTKMEIHPTQLILKVKNSAGCEKFGELMCLKGNTNTSLRPLVLFTNENNYI